MEAGLEQEVGRLPFLLLEEVMEEESVDFAVLKRPKSLPELKHLSETSLSFSLSCSMEVGEEWLESPVGQVANFLERRPSVEV